MLYLLGYLVAVIAGLLFTWLLGFNIQRIRLGQSRASRSWIWDGTLHQQDMSGTFMRYLLRRQPLTRCWYYPVTCYWHRAAGESAAARCRMSLPFWTAAVIAKRALSELNRICAPALWRLWFAAFAGKKVRLTSYLDANDADIWRLPVPADAGGEGLSRRRPGLPRVNLIATQIARGYSAGVLTMRCPLAMAARTAGETYSVRRCVCTAVTATAQVTTCCSICQHRCCYSPVNLQHRIVLSIRAVYNAARFSTGVSTLVQP